MRRRWAGGGGPSLADEALVGVGAGGGGGRLAECTEWLEEVRALAVENVALRRWSGLGGWRSGALCCPRTLMGF